MNYRTFSLIHLLLLLPFLVAFVHPPDYALEKWEKRIRTIRSLQISQTRLLTLSGRSDQVSIEERVWILRPGFYRRSTQGLSRKIHWIVDGQRAGKIENGRFQVEKITDVIEPHEMPYYSGSASRLATLLRQGGIMSGESHWALEGNTEALAIGSLQSDRFLFEKDTYYPLSAYLGEYSYFFPVPRPSKFRTPFPAEIQILRGGELKETVKVHQVEVNKPVSKDLFDIQALVRSVKREGASTSGK